MPQPGSLLVAVSAAGLFFGFLVAGARFIANALFRKASKDRHNGT
jgi:hypothetical protein